MSSSAEKPSEPRPLTPQPMRAVKPSPASSAAGRPPSSSLHQPQASPAAEAQERAQHPQVTAEPPGGRHLSGLSHRLPAALPDPSVIKPLPGPALTRLATPPKYQPRPICASCALESRLKPLSPAPSLAGPAPVQAAALQATQSARPSPSPAPRLVRPAPGLSSDLPACILTSRLGSAGVRILIEGHRFPCSQGHV